MKPSLRLCLPLFALLLGPACGTADAPGAGGLAWLAGCWAAEREGVLVEEWWMTPAGGVLLGISRTTRGSELLGYEHLMIFEKDGALVYRASPSGQPVTDFVATGATADEIVFENPEHDFPRRIIYRNPGPDRVTAHIDDGRGEQQMELPYRRAACPGG